MTNSYFRLPAWRPRLRQLGLTALLLGSTVLAARAQFAYVPNTVTTTKGTYEDLGTTGTVIATADTDEANSAAQNIGFSFTYNGATFTQFVLNTNGLLRLGADAPVTTSYAYALAPASGPFNSTNPADVNLLLPFSANLVGGTLGAEYRVATTGTAGSRVCIIQWKNVADKALAFAANDATVAATQYDNFSFQVKLHEGSNQIDFVYNAPKPGTADAAKSAVIGLKGASSDVGQNVSLIKSSVDDWTAPTFTTGPTALFQSFRYRISPAPEAGRTFSFTPAKANNLAVGPIYTYGRLATTLNLPHQVKAFITNLSYTKQTGKVATLEVTGANTFTTTTVIPDLAPGDTVTITFGAYPNNLNAGTNTVRVSTVADDDDTNNSATYGQVVSATRVSYYDPTAPSAGLAGVGIGSPGAALVAVYKLATAATLTDVTLSLGPDTVSTTPTTYKVVLYDASGIDGPLGRALYTSPIQTRAATSSTAVIPIPNIQVPPAFIIALEEQNNPLYIDYQNEFPLRFDSYYYLAFGSGGPLNFPPQKQGWRLAVDFNTAAPACPAPVGVAVSSITSTSASVSFSALASGPASYQLIYGSPGFDPAKEGTTITVSASPFTLTGLNPASAYQVYMRGNCTTTGTNLVPITKPVTFTTPCAANPVIASFPYVQNFDIPVAGQSLSCGLTVLDANADRATWATTKATPNSGLSAMRYTSAITGSKAADDWFFTPALNLAAGTRYQVAFRYRGEGIANSPSPYVEKLEVKAGPTATPAGQTMLLYTNENIVNTNYALADAASTPVVASFTPASTGTQYIGFHVYSAAEQGNLYLDDLNITAAVVTATTSEALLRAVSVFPNPSTTGVFDLEIHDAKAKRGLDVQVTNNLGQVVYTGTARDNYTNRLDLSRLAPGLYHLLVRNGNERLTRQIAIVK
ncbi:choice-of-anchor J domain-containing protein [uncultured Hymenobacter sp.]|uniref:choice-of-anchor J domain-containing protein n=1 Tax=uncultured Hymenobacter sp. TaxID=170016 RepID=UPI0035CA5D93